MWRARRSISLKVHESAALYVSEDVAVPLSRIPELLVAVEALEREHGLLTYAFGHAGDGNIHLNMTAETCDMEATRRMERMVEKVLRAVVDLGGTISGEHGLGMAKRRFASLELSPQSLTLQKGIKRLVDPGRIVNPGKLFPSPSEITSPARQPPGPRFPPRNTTAGRTCRPRRAGAGPRAG
jgi:D-lactate dehydrogenase (cytochrome)